MQGHQVERLQLLAGNLHLTPIGALRNSPRTRRELPASEPSREDPQPAGCPFRAPSRTPRVCRLSVVLQVLGACHVAGLLLVRLGPVRPSRAGASRSGSLGRGPAAGAGALPLARGNRPAGTLGVPGRGRGAGLQPGVSQCPRFTIHHLPFTLFVHHSLARSRGANYPCREGPGRTHSLTV